MQNPNPDYKHLVQDDRIHASLYTDPQVFDDEMERIFHRGWVFVGHDSEIPRPGDYVTRVQAGRELHWWAGRTTHRLRRVEGELRMSRKTVVLVNAAEPLPNLAFLI